MLKVVAKTAKVKPAAPTDADDIDFRMVEVDRVEPNDYNPNAVAPPEMELLRLSVMADGYTQPIVANAEGDGYVVIDGFHRNRVGKECADVRERIQGYLPKSIPRGAHNPAKAHNPGLGEDAEVEGRVVGEEADVAPLAPDEERRQEAGERR